jgi:NAD(P)-dependent dehydrogenase (short-subunit alcohol dehydrogenase family)
MNPSGRLENKVIIVTGGSSGIGLAASLALSSEGARVVIASRDQAEGERAVKSIESAGGQAGFIKTDITDASQVRLMVKFTIERYGRLDCAFNNAGTDSMSGSSPGTSILEFNEEDWDRVINVNLKGVWLCMKYELPEMLRMGKGSIVNNSSVAGLVGIPNSSAYTASKHGVVGLTKAVALEYARAGIRVNAVCPGAVMTPMLERVFARQPDREPIYAALQPIGRLGSPEEVANCVVWLCSDESSLVTGHALPVEGGWTAQ